MPNPTTFTPSGTPAIFRPGIVAASYPMPAYDSANLDLTITNGCGDAVFIAFAGGVPICANAPGSLRIEGGSTVLLSSNAATLLAAASNPLVSNPQNGNYSTATALSAITGMAGGVVTVTRGTAAAKVTF